MAAAQCIERLGAWEGYELESSSEELRDAVQWCILGLKARPSGVRCCSGCGFKGAPVHDQEERRVRDLPIFEARVELVVPRLRLLCPHCGPKLEDLAWLEPYARVTTRLANSVARLCKVMSVRHVAAFYGLSWSTVKLIDLRHLMRELGPPCLDGVEVIGMDEFAIQKGHRYATVIVEPYRSRPPRCATVLRTTWPARAPADQGSSHGHERLLLRNRDNLPDQDRVRLQELLAANRALTTVYLMKDDLKALWDYRHAGYALRFWEQWYHRAMRSRIEPLKKFAKNFKPLLDGILGHCRFPLGTNLIEGINNKIKVIKRMAYGFRDDAYFFLKIRAAFPGVR